MGVSLITEAGDKLLCFLQELRAHCKALLGKSGEVGTEKQEVLGPCRLRWDPA
jgi:hypothetical protein